MKRLAFLSSGSGSLTKTILRAIDEGIISGVTPVMVISDKESNSIFLGRENKLLTHVVPFNAYSSRKKFSNKIEELLLNEKIDFCFLTFDRLLTGNILKTYKNKLINIHPSLLPAFSGYNTTQKAQASGCSFVGATCHFIDAGIDTGPIINQAVLPVSPMESVDEINHRLFLLRQHLALQALFAFAHDKISVSGKNVTIANANYQSLPINPMILIPRIESFLKKHE